MEKELRIIKNRGHFPIPTITTQGTKIETAQDRDKALEEGDMEVTEMTKAVRQNEENYERGQEQAKNRDEQLTLTRQASRQDFNSLTLINSTPIRNSNTRTEQPAIHFDTNATRYVYPTIMTTNADRYEPPANDSILQGAGSAPGGTAGCNNLWRYNNGANTATHTNL